MEAFPRYSTRPGYSSSYQVNEASKQLVSFSLYSPIIRHLGNTDRHRTRKGQKKKSERERERNLQIFFCNEGNRTNGRLLALAIVIKANFNYSPSPFKTFVYPRRVKLSVKSVISRRHFFKILSDVTVG